MKTSTILLRAAKLLRERHWTQGSEAEDISGKSVPILSDSAERFCAIGAIYRVVGVEAPYTVPAAAEAITELTRLVHTREYGSVVEWNDSLGQTKERVIAGLEAAAHFAKRTESPRKKAATKKTGKKNLQLPKGPKDAPPIELEEDFTDGEVSNMIRRAT